MIKFALSLTTYLQCDKRGQNFEENENDEVKKNNKGNTKKQVVLK